MLQADIGIGPLGHREGLLRAIQDMSDHYSRPGKFLDASGNSADELNCAYLDVGGALCTRRPPLLMRRASHDSAMLAGSGGSDYTGGYRGDGGEASMYSSRRNSPSPGMNGTNSRASDIRVTRALEQRQRLLKELHKAEAREGHRRT